MSDDGAMAKMEFSLARESFALFHKSVYNKLECCVDALTHWKLIRSCFPHFQAFFDCNCFLL
jgi:hypothetical protein